MKLKTFNFSSNGFDYGDYTRETLEEAQEDFAKDKGYDSWEDYLW